MIKSIAVLTHEIDDNIKSSGYFLAYLIKQWEQLGMKVHVVSGNNFVPADIAILHVDRSVVGEMYLELASRYPLTINCAVKDISRSKFSPNLLNSKDRYTGPVIVKTDANYGGVPEQRDQRLSGNSSPLMEGVQRPWRKVEFLESADYPVYEHLNKVPQGVWRNQKLVVEKFLPERLDSGEYRLRTYLFFGKKEFGMWYESSDPVIKFANARSMGRLESIPDSLREIRKAKGFDLGRFDFTLVDGKAVLFDMNKTPVTGQHGQALIPAQEQLAFANEIHGFEY